MNKIEYRTYINVGGRIRSGYAPGDLLVNGCEHGVLWTLDTAPDASAADRMAELYRCADDVFVIHNRPDRPDGQHGPSLSVGDVIVFGDLALTIEPVGFEPVVIDPADLVGVSYLEWLDSGQ